MTMRQQLTHLASERRVDKQESGIGQFKSFLVLSMEAGAECLEPDHVTLGQWTMA